MRFLAIGLVALLSGCTAIGYYAQAVGGHLELMRLAVPVEERLNDADTPPALKEQLARAMEIRDFASRELGLPDNGSYRRYAELDRPFVVWNVFAAPEFSVLPVTSCFFVAGCVSYRGYYSEEAARRQADDYARQGYDTYVGGVPAYSTLGWFDDPLLSTFIRYPPAELARLIFHELAHQAVYVKNDTVFNESFAVAVEEEGVRRWLAREGAPETRANYEAARRRQEAFTALLLGYRGRLAELYAGNGTVEEKRAGKSRLFAQMQEDYQVLKDSWGGFAGYDRFFARTPNNALLASVAAYNELVPAFRALLARNNNDLPAFYAAVREIARLDKVERPAGFRR